MMIRVELGEGNPNRFPSPTVNEEMARLAREGRIYTVEEQNGEIVELKENGWSWRWDWLHDAYQSEEEAFNLYVKGLIGEEEYKKSIEKETNA